MADSTRKLRTIRFGAMVFVVSAMLIALPLILPRSNLNRFLVAFGFLFACFGASCMIHGAWDMIRDRK
jgi:hypothetical protein